MDEREERDRKRMPEWVGGKCSTRREMLGDERALHEHNISA